MPGGVRAATRNVSAVPAAALAAHSSDRRLCVCVASPGLCTTVGAGTHLAARRVRDHRQQRATHADGAHNDAQRQKRRERHPVPPLLRLSIVPFFANFAPEWAPHQSMPKRVSRFEDLKIRFQNGRSLSLCTFFATPCAELTLLLSEAEDAQGAMSTDHVSHCHPQHPLPDRTQLLAASSWLH